VPIGPGLASLLFVRACASLGSPVQSDHPNQKKSREIVVFFVRRDIRCAECHYELPGGSMITLEETRGALCLECADLGHLEYLPRGDAALTRRATKHSRLRAVVLQWSRTRQRYERQGILAETGALELAEAECLVDAARRERQRARRRLRDAEIDQHYVADFAGQIRVLYPDCPVAEAKRVAEHACRKWSGRVGRSSAAKQFDPEAIRLAMAAAVRHRFTKYDELLLNGRDRHEARGMVRAAVEERLSKWRGER
jgi:hypothetical protein